MSVFSKLPNDIIMKIIRMSIGAKEVHKINIQKTLIKIRNARAKVIESIAQPNPWWMSGFQYNDLRSKVGRAHDIMRKAFKLKRDHTSMTPMELRGYRRYRSWTESFDPNTKLNF